MRKVVVFEHLSLDGVMQAPKAAPTRTVGGFEHGSCQATLWDPVIASVAEKSMASQPGSAARSTHV